jgi:RNA polymerase sigma factor (sigma-70 family)
MHDVLSKHRRSPLGDGELLRLFVREGDQKAFTALVHRHGNLVMGVCRRLLRHQQDAEDAFQATFMVLARKASAVQWQDSIQSWLYSTAVRVAQKARVRSARRVYHERQASQSPLNSQSASEAYNGLCDLLDEELLRLPESFRQALIHCYLQGQTRDRAAATLGWSVRTLDRRLERGRNLLRCRLQKRGIGLSVALLVSGLEQSAAGAVSAALARQTVVSAASFAATDSILLDSTATALAEVGLQSLTGSALKFAPVLFCVVAFVALGSGWAAYQGARDRRPVVQVQKPQTPEPERGQPTKKMAKPAVDLFADPLPDGAFTRLGASPFRHEGDLAAYFSPDSSLVISHDAGAVYVWETQTGKLTRKLKIAAECMAVAPKGTLLALGLPKTTQEGGAVVWWDWQAGKEVARVALPSKVTPKQLGFSRDGKQLLVSDEQSLRVLDTESRQEVKFWQRVNADQKLCGFSVDGSFVVINDEDATYVLNLQTTVKTVLEGVKRKPAWVAFSPDGKFLTMRLDLEPARIWEVATGKLAWRLPLGSRNVAYSACFSADGEVLVASGHEENSVLETKVGVWEPVSGKLVKEFPVIGHVEAVSPDKKMLAIGSYTENCYLLSPESGKIQTILPGHGEGAYSVAFSPDGNSLAVGSFDRAVHLWDWRAGHRVGKLKDHTDPVYLVAYSPDGKFLASCGTRGSIRLWNIATGKVLPLGEEVSAPMAFDPKGTWLATSGHDSSVTLRDLQDFKKTWAFLDHIYAYRLLSIHPSGKTFVASEGMKDIRIFPLELGQATAADEKRMAELMALWNDDSIDVREKASQDLAKMGGMAKPLLRDAIKESHSAEVRIRARAALKAVISPKPIAELRGHRDDVTCCAFSPDGQILATGARDGLVLLWEMSTYQCKATLTWPEKGP